MFNLNVKESYYERRTKLLGMLSVVLAAALISGCGEQKEDDSKELVLFTWEGMFPQEVLDGFEEETGVKVVYSNFDTDETMLEKLSQARWQIMM